MLKNLANAGIAGDEKDIAGLCIPRRGLAAAARANEVSVHQFERKPRSESSSWYVPAYCSSRLAGSVIAGGSVLSASICAMRDSLGDFPPQSVLIVPARLALSVTHPQPLPATHRMMLPVACHSSTGFRRLPRCLSKNLTMTP